MAENEALGFVETMGLVAAVEAADAMVKAARVRIKTVGNADAALITVICEGSASTRSFRVGAAARRKPHPKDAAPKLEQQPAGFRRIDTPDGGHKEK